MNSLVRGCEDLLAQLHVRGLERRDPRHPDFVAPREDEAAAPEDGAFQHLVGRDPKVHASPYLAPQEVAERHARDAYGIFEEVYPLVGVEVPHLFQHLQPRRLV